MSFFFGHRLCDMQFSFRQQSGPTTATNIDQQPSDSANKSAAMIPANAIKMPFSLLSQTAQKAMSFDDRDGSRFSVPSAIPKKINESAIKIDCCNKTDTKTINNNNESDYKKSIGSDSNLVVAIDSTKVQCEEYVTTEKCVPLKSFGATPTINVVCAPAVDEDSDALVKPCVEIKTENDNKNADNDKTIESKSNVIGEETETTMETTSCIQLSLDVKKCDNSSMVSVEDLSPSMDEYQECCPSTYYQYDAITGGESVAPGCVPPAPTPAPLIAPLAEVEFYPGDEDTPIAGIDDSATQHAIPVSSSSDSTVKQLRTKKKKPRLTTETSENKSDATTKSTEEINRNAVCPWEDDE